MISFLIVELLSTEKQTKDLFSVILVHYVLNTVTSRGNRLTSG